jgi:preprotein translocase subunit SecA
VKVDSLATLLRVQPVAEAQPVSVFQTTPHQELHPEAGSAEAQRFAPPAAESVAPPTEPGYPAERPGGRGSPEAAGRGARPTPASAPVVAGPKVGRNDPCHCGSGKKFKKCHGQ